MRFSYKVSTIEYKPVVVYPAAWMSGCISGVGAPPFFQRPTTWLRTWIRILKEWPMIIFVQLLVIVNIYPPQKKKTTTMTLENLPSMKMYCISSGKIGIFQPVMLGFRGVKIVYQLDTKIPPKIKKWTKLVVTRKASGGPCWAKNAFLGKTNLLFWLHQDKQFNRKKSRGIYTKYSVVVFGKKLW